MKKRILILRTARMWMFDYALNWVNSKYGDCEIDVVVQETCVSELLKRENICSLIIIPDGKFLLLKHITIIREELKYPYDDILLLYNHKDGRGYWKWNLFLDMLTSKDKTIIAPFKGAFSYPSIYIRIAKNIPKIVKIVYGSIFTLVICLRLQIKTAFQGNDTNCSF